MVEEAGRVRLTDAVVILSHLFSGKSTVDCLDSADVNDDGNINLTDPVGLLNFLFGGGAQPVLSKFQNESQGPAAARLVPVGGGGRRSIRSDFLDVSALGGG